MFTTLAFLLYRFAELSILFVREAKPSDFSDLGTLVLLGSFMAAGVGLAIAVLQSSVESTNGRSTQFISIRPPEE